MGMKLATTNVSVPRATPCTVGGMQGPGFYLVLASTDFTLPQIKRIAVACAVQLTRDVAPEWGQETEGPFPATVDAVATAAEVPAGGIIITLKPTVANPADAGFHTEERNGRPDGEIATQGQSFDDLSVTISHEVVETYRDRYVNRWVKAPDGRLFSLELCDPVEGDWYEITLEDGTKVRVSNFVTKAFFDWFAQPGAKFDFMGILTAGFSVHEENGGYAALIGTDGKEAIEPAGARLDPKKLHAAARTAWRFKDSPLLEDLRARCSDGAAALGGHCAET